MLFIEAKELENGDEVWYSPPYKNVEVVTYLAGPFEDRQSRSWLIVGSTEGVLGFFSIKFIEAKPRIPVIGETWAKKSDGKNRYVDGVTDKWVIVKGSAGAHDSRAFAMLLDNFRKDFRPVL